MLAHLPPVCLPMSKKAQFKKAVSEVSSCNQYWQQKVFSVPTPATQFRKYTEILTEEVIS